MPRRLVRICSCCGWKHPMRDGYGDDPGQSICDQCSAHYPQKLEPAERTLARETGHAAMWKNIAHQIGHKFGLQAVALENEREAAYQARETKRHYAEILDQLSDLHQRAERNRCTCGLMWPCATGSVLEARYGRQYARRKVAEEETRQQLIRRGIRPDLDESAEFPA